MGKNDRKINIPMCAAFILFVLTLISMHMTSGLFARYTTTVTGSDSARVAKFGVKGTVSDPVTMDCTSAESGKFTITVNNESEVAITYDVDVVFTESLKEALDGDKLEVKIDGKSGQWNEESKMLTFTNVGGLAPNMSTAEPHHVLSFLVKDYTYVTSGTNGSTATKDLSFKVNIHAAQVD